LEAHIKVGATAAAERVRTDFDTVLLYSDSRGGGGKSGVNIEEATEYDDEVRRGKLAILRPSNTPLTTPVQHPSNTRRWARGEKSTSEKSLANTCLWKWACRLGRRRRGRLERERER